MKVQMCLKSVPDSISEAWTTAPPQVPASSLDTLQLKTKNLWTEFSETFAVSVHHLILLPWQPACTSITLTATQLLVFLSLYSPLDEKQLSPGDASVCMYNL